MYTCSLPLRQGAAALHVFQNVADKLALDRILTSHVCVSYAQPAMKGIYNIFFFLSILFFQPNLRLGNGKSSLSLSQLMAFKFVSFLTRDQIKYVLLFLRRGRKNKQIKAYLKNRHGRGYTQILKIAGFFQGYRT